MKHYKRVKATYDRGYVNAMDKIRVFIESNQKVMYIGTGESVNFASLAFDAQKPEELAVEVVVHLGAARTSPCTKTPVGQSFRYTFPDVRLERRFNFGNAAVNEFNVLRIVRSQRSFSCSRVRWYVALYDATHIALLRSPAIQPRQCPFPVVVLETEVLEFQVSILRQKVGILSGEFRFLVFHFSLTPF